MPVLPRLETSQSVFAEGALQSQQVNATPADFGGITAQATGQMAQGLAQGGQQLTEVAARLP